MSQKKRKSKTFLDKRESLQLAAEIGDTKEKKSESLVRETRKRKVQGHTEDRNPSVKSGKARLKQVKDALILAKKRKQRDRRIVNSKLRPAPSPTGPSDSSESTSKQERPITTTTTPARKRVSFA